MYFFHCVKQRIKVNQRVEVEFSCCWGVEGREGGGRYPLVATFKFSKLQIPLLIMKE